MNLDASGYFHLSFTISGVIELLIEPSRKEMLWYVTRIFTRE